MIVWGRERIGDGGRLISEAYLDLRDGRVAWSSSKEFEQSRRRGLCWMLSCQTVLSY